MIYELLAALESMTEEDINCLYPQVREPLEKAAAEIYINWFKNEKFVVLLDHVRLAGFTPLHKVPILTLLAIIKDNKDLVLPSLEIDLKGALTYNQINKLLND